MRQAEHIPLESMFMPMFMFMPLPMFMPLHMHLNGAMVRGCMAVHAHGVHWEQCGARHFAYLCNCIKGLAKARSISVCQMTLFLQSQQQTQANMHRSA